MIKKKYENNSIELLELYRESAANYVPPNGEIKTLIIAESPPPLRKMQPRYFYFDHLDTPENLYHGIMTALYKEDFKRNSDNKIKYLKKFSEDGFFLVDAFEFPFYDIDSEKYKIAVIQSQLNRILTVIDTLKPKSIILIHPRVHSGLYQNLVKHNVQILNDSPIEFPVIGKDSFTNFIRQFNNAISRANPI